MSDPANKLDRESHAPVERWLTPNEHPSFTASGIDVSLATAAGKPVNTAAEVKLVAGGPPINGVG